MLNQIFFVDPSNGVTSTIFYKNWNPYRLDERLHGIRQFGSINGFSAFETITSFLNNSVILGMEC
jgi:hypothetical protein